MNGEIGEAIAKLVVDSDGLEFTGFITNARLPNPPFLEGEVWHHIRAEASGRFTDGHRIRTSQIVEIRAYGDTLWIGTENGSRYGILSFTPLGWLYFSNLHRAFSQLDPVPAGTPIFDLNPSLRALQPIESGGLRYMAEKRRKRESTVARPKVDPAKPFRPESEKDYLKEMTESMQKSITLMMRNGTNIIKHG